MDHKYLQEIEAIIQEDTIKSTYKLALLRAIIEIARDLAQSRIPINDKYAYAFSLLQHKVLTYYYPLFVHSSFVPQMTSESPNPETGKQLVIRTEMGPIIQHYNDTGGLEALLSDLEREEIPDEIISEYLRLLDIIKKTFIAQPMKYLGSSIHSEPYSVVQYMATVPQGDSSTPRALAGYFTLSLEYARIFEDSSRAQNLLDSIIQRWVTYTLDLSDRLDGDLTADELHSLLIPPPEREITESCSTFLWKPNASTVALSTILSRCKRTTVLQEHQNDQIQSITDLEGVIAAEYAQFLALQQSIKDAENAVLKAELKVQRIEESIQRIAALYGLYLKDGAPQGAFEIFSQFFDEQKAVQGVYSNTIGRITRSKQKISEHKQEKDQIERKVQRVRHEIAIRERRRDLIHKLQHEIALLDYGSGVQRRPFGYVDKPIARFLTYCGDVAQDIVSQCIHLIPDPTGTTIVKPALPAWFTEEFNTWWRKKEKEEEIISGESSAARRSLRTPTLTFDEPHREIRLIIPPQTIEYQEELDHMSLTIHDGSQILYEEKLPLYHHEEGLSTDKKIVKCMEHPSRRYYVELSTRGASLQSWMIDLFATEDLSCLFDYETGRRLEQLRIPSKEFIFLAKNKRKIAPKTAVRATGRLFGDWYEFQYYVINPVDGLSISDSPAISGEIDRELTKLDLNIDPEYFDKNLQVDEKKVILGSPPPLQVLYRDEETLFQTHLFIHPHGQDSLSKPIIYSFADIQEGIAIDPAEHTCTVDLSHPNLLGRECVGAFTIRIRNDVCRTDIRVECIFLPDVSYRFSESLYLPAKDGVSPIQLEITCPASVRFEPEGSMKVERTEVGFLVTSNPAFRIQGRLQYPLGEDRVFEGMVSISVPQVTWRFEDQVTGSIYQSQRTVPTISDGEYLSLGTDLGLRVFLPEFFSGKGKVSMQPGKQTVTSKITNGRGYFPLAQFNDTIKASGTKVMHFEFAMESQHGVSVAFPLFVLQKWHVSHLQPPKISTDPSGNRIIEITWEEHGIAAKRFLLIWGREGSVGISRRYYAEDLPAFVQTYTICEDREKLTLPPNIYLQFYRVRDDWDALPASFPGIKAPNVFHITIGRSPDPVLEDGEGTDDPALDKEREENIRQLISEIETGDAERCSRAINEIRQDHSVPRHGYRLLRKYLIANERLREALFVAITNTGIPLETRSAGVELLGKNFTQAEEHMLIKVLGSPDSTVSLRVSILRSLGYGNTKECLKALLNSLDDSNPEIRGEAATSLKMTDSKDAVKPLIKLLGDESPAVQRKTAASLGYMRSPMAIEPLVSLALDREQDLDLRVTALTALENFYLHEEIIRKLFALAKDDSEGEEIRKTVTSTLRNLGQLEAKVTKDRISKLIFEMREAPHERRTSAIKQLGIFKNDEKVISALMESAQDESTDIRRASAESLIRINSPKAIPALIRLLDDPDNDIQGIAELACKQMLKQLMPALKSVYEDRRNVAARHLSEMESFAVKPLITMLRDADKFISKNVKAIYIRKSTVKALSGMSDPYATELIIQALKDGDDWIVWGTAQALGAIGDKSAVSPLESTNKRYEESRKGRRPNLTSVRNEIQKALKKLKEIDEIVPERKRHP